MLFRFKSISSRFTWDCPTVSGKGVLLKVIVEAPVIVGVTTHDAPAAHVLAPIVTLPPVSLTNVNCGFAKVTVRLLYEPVFTLVLERKAEFACNCVSSSVTGVESKETGAPLVGVRDAPVIVTSNEVMVMPVAGVSCTVKITGEVVVPPPPPLVGYTGWLQPARTKTMARTRPQVPK